MKTFIEFLEEAYLVEMRKEDEVAGKKKTPLTIKRTRTLTTRGSVRRSPEGSGNKWKVTPAKTETHTDVTGNPLVSTGRFRQGGQGGDAFGYKRHPHGGKHGGMTAGEQRGVKKVPGEKKPEVGHVTPAQKLANKKAVQANLSYLFGRGR